MNRILTCLLLVSLGSGCSHLIPARDLSHVTDGEEVVLRITDVPAEEAAGATALAFAGVAINVALGAVKRSAEKAAKEFVGSYEASASSDSFYSKEAAGDLARFDAKVFTLTRTVTDARCKPEAAMVRVRLEPHPSKLAFTIVPQALKISCSKAKIADRKLYLPWTSGAKETLDLVLQVSVESSWTDAAGVPMGRTESASFKLTKVELGKEYNNFPCQGDLCTKWFLPVPRSVAPSKNIADYGNGFYRVSVSVIETDDYKKRVETAVQVLSDNQAGLVEALKKAIEAAGQ